jgi:Trk K+ transport system NAD-binding subunit
LDERAPFAPRDAFVATAWPPTLSTVLARLSDAARCGGTLRCREGPDHRRGQVGTAVTASLHTDHDVTVVDLNQERLNALSYRYDILTVEGNGASRAVTLRAGIADADLVIASTDRDEVNIVAALQARQMCVGKVIARTRSAEYLDAWRAGQFDVDFMVSSEEETANAIARHVGMPSAVQTDVFADGRVEMVEFAVDPGVSGGVVGKTIAEARVPDECVVASIIRGERVIIPGGADRIEAGDRLVDGSVQDVQQQRVGVEVFRVGDQGTLGAGQGEHRLEARDASDRVTCRNVASAAVRSSIAAASGRMLRAVSLARRIGSSSSSDAQRRASQACQPGPGA